MRRIIICLLIPLALFAALMLVDVPVNQVIAAQIVPTQVIKDVTIFSATVEVVPATTLLLVGETLTITVNVDDDSISFRCTRSEQYTTTLTQKSPATPIFTFLSPSIQGPGGSVTYTLTAINTGQAIFHYEIEEPYSCAYGQLTGFRAFGDVQPITVRLEHQLYLPFVMQ
jgi:hypothetical protein